MMMRTVPAWSVLSSREEYGGAVPLLSLSAEHGVRARTEGEGRAASEDTSGYRRVRTGDIVINRLSARDGAVASSSCDGLVSPAYWVLVPAPDVDSRFLHYLLRSAPYQAEIRRVSKWMPPAQFDLPWDQFRKLSLRLPSIGEQKFIAQFLDHKTARIASLAKKKQQMIELLEERALAVVSKVVVPPAGMTRLGRFARIQTGLTVDGSRPVEKEVVTRPYLRVANVQPGRLALDTVTEITVPRAVAERATLRAGDVLMTEGGDLDKLGRGTVWRDEIPGCLHQNHIFAVRPDPTKLDPEYLALLTQTAHARSYFERTGVKTTNLASTSSSKVMDFPVPVLTLEDQRELVRLALEARRPGDALIARLSKQIRLLAEHQQTLIAAAVAGELDAQEAA